MHRLIFWTPICALLVSATAVAQIPDYRAPLTRTSPSRQPATPIVAPYAVGQAMQVQATAPVNPQAGNPPSANPAAASPANPGANSQFTTTPIANSAAATQSPFTTPTPTANSGGSAATLPNGSLTASAAGTTITPRAVTHVSKGTGTLPNEHGQVWREYDIRPYTSRVENIAKPEQAIVDWILRETGTEVWFSQPLGLLSADKETLRVYHTPEMQQLVTDVVDRFVASQAESYTFGVRLITVRSPNWRTKAYRVLRPVAVQTPGIEAWLLSKEDAAVLLADMRKRTDFREHNSANLLIHNGQAGNVAVQRPKTYMRSVNLRPEVWPGYQMEMGQVQEGFTLELSPLLSKETGTVDAVIKCNVDQVEKLVPVSIDVPTPADPRQRVEIQVPQMVSWRLHERFRWPKDQVLLISAGVVATPSAGRATALGFSNPFDTSPPRADGLMFVESQGIPLQLPAATGRPAAAVTSRPSVSGRY